MKEALKQKQEEICQRKAALRRCEADVVYHAKNYNPACALACAREALDLEIGIAKLHLDTAEIRANIFNQEAQMAKTPTDAEQPVHYVKKS